MNAPTGGDHHARDRLIASLIRPQWPAPAGVVAFTTLRGPAGYSAGPFGRFNLGSRGGDDPAAVAANRALLDDLLPSPPRWLRQVHGTTVVIEPGFDEPEADASVSRVPGSSLAVLSADCLPVLLCSRAGNEIAAAHAGWRGLAAGVLENTIATLRTAPAALLAWLGPAAGPDAYEVGEEVRDAFVGEDAGAAAAFAATRPGHWHCDLFALARRRLRACGVESIHGGGLCTLSGPTRFFSHRRDGACGRMASVIALGNHV